MNTASRDTRFLYLAALLVAVLGATAGYSLWQLQGANRSPATAALLVLPEPRALADFSLVDQDGQPFSLEQLRGHWSLLFFGYSHCPDVCPGALYDLQNVHRALANTGGPDHQVVFVSVDAERDTPQRMKDYVSYFDPSFVGVSGPDAQLQPLALQMGVAYRVEPHEPGASDYAVDHSASFFLVNPDGRLYGVFPAPHDSAAITQDLLAVID